MELTFGIIGALSGTAGIAFGLISFFRNKKADDKTEGEQGGVLHADIGYIKKGIDGIEHRLDKQEDQYIGVIEQLAEIKVSTKQAHKRIDTLEKFHTP